MKSKFITLQLGIKKNKTDGLLICLTNNNHTQIISTLNKFAAAPIIISKKNIIWGEHQQQDSQEFLTFLLNTIEDEIKDNVLYLPGRKIEKTKLNIENLMALKNWEDFTKKEFSMMKKTAFIINTSRGPIINE